MGIQEEEELIRKKVEQFSHGYPRGLSDHWFTNIGGGGRPVDTEDPVAVVSIARMVYPDSMAADDEALTHPPVDLSRWPR